MLNQTSSLLGAAPSRAPSILVDLWRRRLDTIISGIANRDTYYLQIANAAEHISAEYHGRFLIELIQNANDQAVRQGLTDSLVTIHRTRRLLAVGNSGQSFDDRKVDAITSLFKSDKTADECIGNKGIGFKAVFQVADTAEVFSSAPGGHLAADCPIAFRMVRKPFEDQSFAAEIRAIAGELLDAYIDRRRVIEGLFSSEDTVDAVLREAARAAWFTFPLPCTNELFRTRIGELEISEIVLRKTQTLVVLPTDDVGQSSGSVEGAIDEVHGGIGPSACFPAGVSFLFLPGIAGIHIDDRVRGFRAELGKEDVCPGQALAQGVVLRRRRMTRMRTELASPDASPTTASQDWWVAERVIGQGDDEKSVKEREAVREAIEALRLPEENWKGIEQIPVAVALPDPARRDDEDCLPLGPRGRFCIGLPTHVRTGLPLWVSAHFHGKIDRTAIDFESAYNDLILGSAVELAETLLERLKSETGRATRRLVTLALEHDMGVLAEEFYASDGIAHKEVVLGESGSFLRASDLRLPQDADLSMFKQLIIEVGNVSDYGFYLPDALLLAGARKILDGLSEDIEADDDQYLQRPPNRPSLLEHAAKTHRRHGPGFWEPFLAWILARFGHGHQDTLADQAVLPTGRSELTTAKSRVFFLPMRVTARAADDGGKPLAVDDAGDELAAIDDTVASLLKFFDDTAVNVRAGTTRDYTPLAQRLAPDTGRGLVRRPRQEDLINDALIPAMRESRSDSDQMLALLRQALLWLVGAQPKSKQRVAVDKLLVPVSGQGDAWEWAKPNTVYLGEGWDNEATIGLLTRAYGDRPNKQLVPWERFEKKAIQRFKEADRRWWLERMKEIGVSSSPRIIRASRTAVAESRSYSHLTAYTSLACPVPCPDAIWKDYLAHIAKRSANRKTSQQYYLNEISWIDGLENDAIRATVMEAVLRKSSRYDRHVSAKLSRWSGEDPTDVHALWVYALRSRNWELIPTSPGPCTAAKAWYLSLESRSAKADRFAFLPCVKPEFSGARALLKAFGVVAIDEAHIPRLAKALHEVAKHIEEASEEDLRHIDAIASDLYEAIQGRLENEETADGVKKLLDAPVPLLRGERISRAKLGDVAQILIDDDPIRRRYIQGFPDAWVLPKRFQRTYDDLVAALRACLGQDRVACVSEMPIDVQFIPLEAGTPVLDYLRQAYPGRALAEDLALLILKGATEATSPHDAVFRQAWGRITRTRVIRGRFEDESSVRACYDGQHSGGPALLVASVLPSHDVVGETWQLIGPSYRPIWAAYTQALREETTDRFFQEYGVSSAERTEVEVAIGLGFEQRLRRYQPVCLALWRRVNTDRPSEEFHREWEQHVSTPETAGAWLNWDDLNAEIELASRAEEPEGSLTLLEGFGLSVLAWQSARGELGEAPWRFVASQRTYESARETVAGHIMAWFAYLVVPRASGASGPTAPVELANPVKTWVEQIRGLPVPSEVAEDTLSSSAIIARAAQDALTLVEGLTSLQGASVLIEPLEVLAKAAPSAIVVIKLKDEPDKAAVAYERDAEAMRAQQADATVDAVLKVAVALALRHGEQVADSAIRDHELVTLLSQGAWANRVSVLAATRYALEGAVPATASRMKERQAFRDFDDWRTLWKKFEELGEIPVPAAPPPPKPRFDVLGSGWTREEFDASASAGPGGTLAQKLEASVNPTIDVAAMRTILRAKVTSKRPGSGRGGGGGARQRVPDEYLVMLGAVGEYFVYQQLKVICPDLDITNWLSRARERFGFDRGDDLLGYDFAFNDVRGILTGLPNGPRCHIEVKSSAHGGGNSFEMSTHEWEVALRCHQEPTFGTYVILRVADVASAPRLTDVLVDPVGLHFQGVLDYASRDLLVVVGAANSTQARDHAQ